MPQPPYMECAGVGRIKDRGCAPASDGAKLRHSGAQLPASENTDLLLSLSRNFERHSCDTLARLILLEKNTNELLDHQRHPREQISTLNTHLISFQKQHLTDMSLLLQHSQETVRQMKLLSSPPVAGVLGQFPLVESRADVLEELKQTLDTKMTSLESSVQNVLEVLTEVSCTFTSQGKQLVAPSSLTPMTESLIDAQYCNQYSAAAAEEVYGKHNVSLLGHSKSPRGLGLSPRFKSTYALPIVAGPRLTENRFSAPQGDMMTLDSTRVSLDGTRGSASLDRTAERGQMHQGSTTHVQNGTISTSHSPAAGEPIQDVTHFGIFCEQIRDDLAAFQQCMQADVHAWLETASKTRFARVSQRVSFSKDSDDVDAELSSGAATASRQAGRHSQISKSLESAFNAALGVQDESAVSMKSSTRTDLHKLTEREYDCQDLYKTEGLPQRLARSDIFLHVTLSVTMLNCIYIGVEADNNSSDILYEAPAFYIIFDNAFCAYFFIELGIRLMAFEDKSRSLTDAWFRFDACLLCLMMFETWVMAPFAYAIHSTRLNFPVQPLRLLRFLRLTRVARLVRTVPELVTMSHGLVQGARATAASVVMISLLIYIFAIAIHALLKDDDDMNSRLSNVAEMNFSSIGHSMWIMLMCGTFTLDGTGEVLRALVKQPKFAGYFSCFLLLLFIFITALVICNLLIGIMCEVVAECVQEERDSKAITLLKQSILTHLQQYDDGDGMISSEELERVLNEPSSRRVLDRLNVDRVFLLALQKMLYMGDIPIRNVMELMLSCRGDSPATVHTIGSSITYLTLKLDEISENFGLSSLDS